VTWLAVHGVEAARAKAGELTAAACAAAASLPDGARLRDLTQTMLRRTS